MVAAVEVHEEFSSRLQWEQFCEHHPQLFTPALHPEVVRQIRANGLYFEFEDRWIPPDGVEIDETRNFRETISHEGIISRHRAVLGVLQRAIGGLSSPRVYAAEALSSFAGLLRERFDSFVGSEYADSPLDARPDLRSVRREDLLDLSLPDASFDVAIANEVFEHVPNLDQAIAELGRILDDRGVLIATFPFNPSHDDDLVKARVANGRVVHLAEPEFHDNPLDERGSLVFQIPGWSVLDRLRAAGFASACFDFVLSARRGVLANRWVGVFVLRAERRRSSPSSRV
jgi:SAM-dependent methyltransferase